MFVTSSICCGPERDGSDVVTYHILLLFLCASVIIFMSSRWSHCWKEFNLLHGNIHFIVAFMLVVRFAILIACKVICFVLIYGFKVWVGLQLGFVELPLYSLCKANNCIYTSGLLFFCPSINAGPKFTTRLVIYKTYYAILFDIISYEVNRVTIRFYKNLLPTCHGHEGLVKNCVCKIVKI